MAMEKVQHTYSPTSPASEIRDWTELEAIEATASHPSDHKSSESQVRATTRVKEFKQDEADFGSTELHTFRSDFLSTENLDIRGAWAGWAGGPQSELLSTNNRDLRADYARTTTEMVLANPPPPTEKASSSQHPSAGVEDPVDPAGPAPAFRNRRPDLGPVPQLLLGSKLDKAIPMQHNHWIKIGRDPKSHVLLSHSSVSRKACSLRWDHHQRKVELRNEVATTEVNGKRVEVERINLDHGDLIRIAGKGLSYDFRVDLRPVGLGSVDPRTLDKSGSQESLLVQRRDRLRHQLRTLGQKISDSEAAAFEKEKLFYEVSTRRRLRLKDIAEREASLKYYLEETRKLEEKLEESRRRWREKLEGVAQKHTEDMAPCIENCTNMQEKLEKLTLKKDELVRSIHPERYAVADVAVMDVHGGASQASISMPENSSVTGGGSATRPSAEARSGGEDDAFAGLSGLEEEQEAPPAAHSDSDLEMVQPGEKRQAADAPAAAPPAKAPRVVDEDEDDDEDQAVLAIEDATTGGVVGL